MKRALDTTGDNSAKKAKSKSSSSSFTKIIGFSDSDEVSSSLSTNSDLHRDTVQITTYRTTNKGWLYGTVEEKTLEFTLPPPSKNPLEDGSTHYDEYGSLHDDLSQWHDGDDSSLADPEMATTPSTPNNLDEEGTTRSEAMDTRTSTKTKKTKSKTNRMQAALLHWLPFRQTGLEEIIRHEGLDETRLNSCNVCKGMNAIFKCPDCFTCNYYCEACIVRSHRQLPTHHLRKYDGQFYRKISHRELGMRLQLGHDDGTTCLSPIAGPEPFTLVDITGIHSINLSFCNCGHSKGGSLRYVQVLRAGWFPATVDLPATAFTFACLDTFLEMNQQSKMNTYDFYIGLTRLTDNTGRISNDSRYHEFSLVVRLWRHLQMLKRAGRAHDPKGVEATKQGELAVECPACPHPSRNLPQNWEKLPNQRLYTQYLAMDANFRQKLKDRGLKDVELAPGWAFFVEEEEFQKRIAEHNGDNIESNSCRSQFSALLHATNRKADGYKATGVGAVVCGRHSFMRPNGVCDLQLGECYVNMDFIFLRTLVGTEARYVLVSYDIACQWSKHLLKRQDQFPCYMRLSPSVVIIFAIPKFHLPGHGPACQTKYSLNYLPTVGRTYGEGVESEWAHINALSTSAREMAPAMRHELLNAQWNSSNWGKVTVFGPSLKKNLIEAITECRKHKAVFEDFSATFKKDTLIEWEAMIVDWEQDKKKPDPYAEPSEGISLNDAKLQLANEEAEELSKAGAVPLHTMTASAFLSEGLELEEQQRLLLLRDTLRDHQLNGKSADLQERRNSLWIHIDRWHRDHQDIIMPTAASIRVLPEDRPATTAGEEGAAKHPETLRLCLPSSLPKELVDERMASLRSKEARLRRAQAEDALASICRLRRTITGVYIFKRLNVSGTGQKPNTRVRDIFDRLTALCNRAAARYRAARAALHAIDPNGAWQEKLKVLRDSDISGPQRDEDNDKSEGRYVLSWIWRTPGQTNEVSSESEEFSEGMRIEWSKARARYLRWREEIELLVEEMRRVVAFLEWKSSWWTSKCSTRPDAREDIRRGLEAYGKKQAAIMHDIAYRCVELWAPLLKATKMPVPWVDEFNLMYTAAPRSDNIFDVDYNVSTLFSSD